MKGEPRISGLGFDSPLNPGAQIAAARAVLAMEPDVLVSSLWKSAPAAIIAKLLRPRMKLVAFFHSAKRTHGLDRIFHWALLRSADAVWADSTATLDTVKAERPDLPTRTISYIIDPAPSSAPPRTLGPRFVSWSRIHPHKGMDRAIDLFARLVDRGVDAQFDIWGPDQGPQAGLQQQAERLGIADRIHFHGAVSRSRLAEIARDASFLLQLSRQEGMAMVVVEAMQFGLVPIVTPVGEIRRYCRDAENSLLVDSDNLDEAANRIVQLLTDLERYRRMSAAAHDQWQGKPIYADEICAAAAELAENSQ